MLSKKERFPLRKNRDVLRKSTRMPGTFIDLFFLPSQDVSTQASVIVGKNVSLLSTVRNHIKRMVYDILQRKVFPTRSGTFILRVKPKGKTARYEDLAHEISHIIAKK